MTDQTSRGKGGSRRRDRRPPPPGRMVDVDGIGVHIEERGSGEGILLLHGYLASTAIWYSVMDRLAAAARAVALDFPGAGYSQRPPQAAYTIPWFAGFVERLLPRVDLKRPLVISHSLGGAVALHAAAARPELFRGLVLVSPLVFQPPPPPGLRLAKRFPGAARVFFESFLGRACISMLMQRALYANGTISARQSARQLLDTLDAPGGWEAATRIGLQAHDHSPDAALLEKIKTPCLVVWGSRDKSHPLPLGHKLVETLGEKARLEVFAGLGHNCQEEDPDRFCRLVGEFWQDLNRERK